MQKKSKKGLILALTLGMAITAVPSITAFAASVNENYDSYALPARQGNNYTGTHQKVTDEQYIVNKVTDITHADTAVFWATDGVKTVISNEYEQKLGNQSTIQFRKQIKSKADVIMGMRNADYQIYQNGFVSGWVNFK
ncbi:hypothetical protein [Paenibacillus bovis]|uniref:Uncharacterized protein n=1 Tax=Paenibacillus bovis TaxID=1616788 RepID=A0A172ZBX5_9BACL|nr:hypothetical protein [Paenibacillus bovis]ANF95003.1 hypothetical protein AR543_02450 [Paenibacillus bovis]